MTDLRRYTVSINFKRVPAEHGHSAESTLKLIENALREGATHIHVYDKDMSILSTHKPWRE